MSASQGNKMWSGADSGPALLVTLDIVMSARLDLRLFHACSGGLLE